jgi:putative nucleotidyltransferase with HDIG domain
MTVVTSIRFIDELEALPPLPSVAQEVLAIAESPKTTVNDIAQAVSRDPAIAAKVLRVVNSPFYGMTRNVTQMSRAVSLLGSIAVRNLIIGLCVRDTLASSASNLPEHEAISKHSIAVGSMCELIARHIGYKPAEEALVAGMLHDVGQLAMVALRPETFRKVIKLQQQGCHDRLLAIERELFGIDHDEAGFHILNRWGLPRALCDVAGHHHCNELKHRTGSTSLLAMVVLADIYAQTLGIGLDLCPVCPNRARSAATILGLTECDQLRVIHALDQHVQLGIEMFRTADDARNSSNSPSRGRADWVSNVNGPTSSISVSVLERAGYEVHLVLPEAICIQTPSADLIVLDLPPSDDSIANELASTLAAGSQGKILLLTDRSEDAPNRARVPRTHIYQLPRLFTAFDLEWVEEQSTL